MAIESSKPLGDVYTRITNKIIKQLEKGTAPWLNPWTNSPDAPPPTKLEEIWPRNAVSGHFYSGINVFMCWIHLCELGMDRNPPLFITFKQAKEAGGSVRKGERGITVIAYRTGTHVVEDADGKEQEHKTFNAFGHTVFHVSQCDGLKLPKHKAVVQPTGLNDDEDWLKFLDATGVRIKHGGNIACYKQITDTVCMPAAKHFKTPHNYKSVTLHELTHWTAHPTRLGRNLANTKGSEGYAKEELIAELGAAFLCARMGIIHKELRHADYIGDWLEVLHNDKRAIVTASSKARIAATYIEELAAVHAVKIEKPKRKRLKN